MPQYVNQIINADVSCTNAIIASIIVIDIAIVVIAVVLCLFSKSYVSMPVLLTSGILLIVVASAISIVYYHGIESTADSQLSDTIMKDYGLSVSSDSLDSSTLDNIDKYGASKSFIASDSDGAYDVYIVNINGEYCLCTRDSNGTYIQIKRLDSDSLPIDYNSSVE